MKWIMGLCVIVALSGCAGMPVCPEVKVSFCPVVGVSR